MYFLTMSGKGKELDDETYIFGSTKTVPVPKGPTEQQYKKELLDCAASIKDRKGKQELATDRKNHQLTIEGGKVAVKEKRVVVFVSTKSPKESTRKFDPNKRFVSLECGTIGHHVAQAVFLALSDHPVEPYSAMLTLPKDRAGIIFNISRGVREAIQDKWPLSRFAALVAEKETGKSIQAQFPGLASATGNQEITDRFENRFNEAGVVGHRIRLWIEQKYLPRLPRPIIDAAIRQQNTTNKAIIPYRGQGDVFGYVGNDLYFISIKTYGRPSAQEINAQELELIKNSRLVLGTSAGLPDSRLKYSGGKGFYEAAIPFEGFYLTKDTKSVTTIQVYVGENNPSAAIIKHKYSREQVIGNEEAKKSYQSDRDQKIAAAVHNSIGKPPPSPYKSPITVERTDRDGVLKTLEKAKRAGMKI